MKINIDVCCLERSHVTNKSKVSCILLNDESPILFLSFVVFRKQIYMPRLINFTVARNLNHAKKYMYEKLLKFSGIYGCMSGKLVSLAYRLPCARELANKIFMYLKLSIFGWRFFGGSPKNNLKHVGKHTESELWKDIIFHLKIG